MQKGKTNGRKVDTPRVSGVGKVKERIIEVETTAAMQVPLCSGGVDRCLLLCDVTNGQNWSRTPEEMKFWSRTQKPDNAYVLIGI